jgi:hypothetical protein
VSAQGVDPGLAARLRYVLDPPRAIVTHSVAQAIATGPFVALAFDTRVVNVGGVWLATANTRLTAPVSGWYDYWAGIEWAAGAGTYRSLAVRKNGATFLPYLQVPPVGGAATRQVDSGPVELAAGDYLEVLVSQDTAGALNVNAGADYTPRFALARRCDKS